jgi:hypothetical protein
VIRHPDMPRAVFELLDREHEATAPSDLAAVLRTEAQRFLTAART